MHRPLTRLETFDECWQLKRPSASIVLHDLDTNSVSYQKLDFTIRQPLNIQMPVLATSVGKYLLIGLPLYLSQGSISIILDRFHLAPWPF
jgi:hypothetical protein